MNVHRFTEITQGIRSMNGSEQKALLCELPHLLKISFRRHQLKDKEIVELVNLSKQARATGRGIKSFKTWKRARRYLWSL